MANTFSRIYIHVVFSTWRRQHLISKTWKDLMFRYITGIVHNKGHKIIAINGVSDHIHILIGYKMTTSIPDLVRDIKSCSTKFINDQKLVKYKFSWQVGFGVFSCGHRQFSDVAKYIENQEAHHAKIPYDKEYLDLLKRHEIEFDEKYVFDGP